MLTRLGSALDDWRPAAGAPRDPLAIVRSAWTELVGEDVAQAAQPVALTGTALVVLTASSAWSSQLSYLERQIVHGVRALGVTSVERLRFRVGQVRAPTRAGAEPGLARGRARAGASTRPGSLDEAVERLRRQSETRRAAHHAAGGSFCAACGQAIARGTSCRPCRDAAESRQARQLERLLFEAPWLDAEEVLALVPGLSATDYDRYRRSLLRRWVDELWLARRRHNVGAPIDAVRVRKVASSYVLLETRIDPNRLELESPIRQNALGPLYAFIRSVEATATPS